jgi:protein arginine N-methyltransferase 1
MLADGVRMSTYARAIQELVPRDSVVVDVGTGSGVLACLAAKRARKVYAVEHSSLIDRAKRLVDSNGISNIELVRGHSRDFSPPEKVDVLLHEQLGMNLVDEDMIANLGDLRDRVLAPHGIILPGRFEMRAVPVSLRAEARIPFLHEQKMYGLDFSAFAPVNRPEIAAKGWDRRLIDPQEVEITFASPERLFALDLASREGSSLPDQSRASFVCGRDGRLDGFVVFFRVEFSPDVAFETGPGSPKTHWASRLYRTEQAHVRTGDRLGFSLKITSPIDPAGWRWEHSHQPA